MNASQMSAGTIPEVAAVVVTYNRKALLLACIQCLLAQQNACCDILVIDNASTDGTKEALLSLGSHPIHYYNTGQNLGGAGGFNAGIRIAMEMGYQRLWLMDDDTQPGPDALSALLEAERIVPQGYGFLSSIALWTDGMECKMNRQKLRKDYYLDLPLLRSGVVRAEQATFVSLFLPKETVLQVGLPIRDFFIWGDDIEYTRRIAVRHHMPSYVVGKSQVIHVMPENNGSSIALDTPDRISRYRYAFRNENYTYRKEGLKGFAYYSAKCALNIGRILAASSGNKPRRMGIIISQFFAGLFFNPPIEYIPDRESRKDRQC